MTAGLFLLDIAGPRSKIVSAEQKFKNSKDSKNVLKKISQKGYIDDIERDTENSEKNNLDSFEKNKIKHKDMNGIKNEGKNGIRVGNEFELEPPKLFKGK